MSMYAGAVDPKNTNNSIRVNFGCLWNKLYLVWRIGRIAEHCSLRTISISFPNTSDVWLVLSKTFIKNIHAVCAWFFCFHFCLVQQFGWVIIFLFHLDYVWYVSVCSFRLMDWTLSKRWNGLVTVFMVFLTLCK